PEDDSQFFASFGEAKESIAAIATDIAAGTTADLAFGDVSPNIVFRAVGVERDFGPLKHFEQLGLIGVESFEQAVEGDEAGLTGEDAIKPRRQGRFALFGWRDRRPARPALETSDLVAQRSIRSLQLRHLLKQFDHQALQLGMGQAIKIDRRRHAENESDSRRRGNLIIIPPWVLPLLPAGNQRKAKARLPLATGFNLR